MLEPSRDTAVVVHDAGAANIIFAWIDAGLVSGDRVHAAGPAAVLWRAAGRPAPTPSIAAAIDGADMVLTGTGWASDLEHAARRAARDRGLPSVAVIDHWVNYAARFERDGEQVLPDEIWVTDDEAEEIATRTFGGLPVRQKPNLYLRAEVERIRPLGRQRASDVLYVLEPMRDDWGRGTAGEFQALDYLVERWAAIGAASDARLRLRPHPSDAADKYDDWIARHPGLAARDTSATLAEAIGEAGIVAGCNSFALVVALEAGRRVVCTLPPWAPPCVLPHGGLMHLKSVA